MTKKYLTDKNVWWVNNQLCVPLYQCPREPKDYLGTLELGPQMVTGPFFVFICMLMFRIIVYCKLVKWLAI